MHHRASICQPCQKPHYIEQWLAGKVRGGSDRAFSRVIRLYLIEKAGGKCQRCGFGEPHPDDGGSILEIEHLNGNGLDHRPCNVIVICPNCHALTSTYRGRNAGKGRPLRYL
jgi:hypothetical protein